MNSAMTWFDQPEVAKKYAACEENLTGVPHAVFVATPPDNVTLDELSPGVWIKRSKGDKKTRDRMLMHQKTIEAAE